MITGVALATMHDGVPQGSFVHQEDEHWCITSNVPVQDLLDCAVLDELLPGSLGTYVYPSDAVLCRKERTTTTGDVQTLIETRRRDAYVESRWRANPMTVVATDTNDASDSSDEEDDEDDPDASEDNEEPVEDVWLGEDVGDEE